MSETRDAFGPLLQQLQAQMRTLRAEMAAFQAAIYTLIPARAEQTELFIQEQTDRIMRRLDQTERSVEERLSRIEQMLADNA